MFDQAPAFILLAPFLAAVLVALVGIKFKRVCFPLVVAGLGCSVTAAIQTLLQVIETGTIRYYLGGWAPPFGIEFRIDGLNALVALAVSVVALITAVYSHDRVPDENGDKISQYYALFLLLVTGLLGMVVTGDAFNLYVLLEVSALTSYALIAMGPKRATLAAYKYAIMGTIGASFYLLGVGYLYIKTGSLNMFDIHQVIVEQNLYPSTTDTGGVYPHNGGSVDKNGFLPVTQLVAKLLCLRTHNYELPVGTTGNQGNGLRDDTYDPDGLRSAICFYSAQLGQDYRMDVGHRHSVRLNCSPGPNRPAQDACLPDHCRGGLYGWRCMASQYGRHGGGDLPPHRRRFYDPLRLSVRRNHFRQDRQVRHNRHRRFVCQDAPDHGRIGRGRLITDRHTSDRGIFQQVVLDPGWHKLRPLGVCAGIAYLQFGQRRSLLQDIRIRAFWG